MNRIFVTGDRHGKLASLKDLCDERQTTKDDLLIMLGDVGLNYYGDSSDTDRKKFMSKLPITFLCLHGNHENRPQNISTYERRWNEKLNTYAWTEPEYTNILFAENGDLIINGRKFLIMDGAYSVDKDYRLAVGYHWWADEQMSDKDKEKIRKIVRRDPNYDFVLSHTAPLHHEPTYLFMTGIDQSKVDKTTETFLQEICDQISFKRWFYGHYHDDKDFGDGFHILYNNIIQII